MHVRIKVNLGSRDAERFGLRFDQCKAGDTPTVTDEAGEWLIRHGIAEPVESKPKSVTGVSPRPSIAEAQSPEIQSTTNPGQKAGNKHKES